jgi:ribosomal subunit interface protein
MNFLITGDGVTVTSSLREHAAKRLSVVLRNCTVVPSVEVILKVHPHAKKEARNTVTVIVKADQKKTISRESTTYDMYKSINLVADLIGKEILIQKERTVSMKAKDIPKYVKAKNLHNFNQRVAVLPFSGAERRQSILQVAA